MSAAFPLPSPGAWKPRFSCLAGEEDRVGLSGDDERRVEGAAGQHQDAQQDASSWLRVLDRWERLRGEGAGRRVPCDMLLSILRGASR